MDQVRGPGRIAALDVPGIDPFSVGQLQPVPPLSGDRGLPCLAGRRAPGPRPRRATGDRRHRQLRRRHQCLADVALRIRSAVDPKRRDRRGGALRRGVRQGRRRRGPSLRDALRASGPPGRAQGLQVWNDLREQNDLEAPSRSTAGSASVTRRRTTKGNAIHRRGQPRHRRDACGRDHAGTEQSASNALLVGEAARPPGTRSSSRDRRWATTTRGSLRGGRARRRHRCPRRELPRLRALRRAGTRQGLLVERDLVRERHHRPVRRDALRRRHALPFEGECREMTTFDAGTLGFGNEPVAFHETVHGPVIGYATVDGERVALSSKRSTRGREVASAFGLRGLQHEHGPRRAELHRRGEQDRLHVQLVLRRQRNIAMFSSGRLPMRDPQVDIGPAHDGTGQYEWRGFLTEDQHPHGVNPAGGAITNWNNKPAAGWQSADDNWAYGSIHRSSSSTTRSTGCRRTRSGPVVAAMNRAATQDLRTAQVVLRDRRGAADRRRRQPARQQMLDLLELARRTARAGSTGTSTARSTIPAPRSWTRPGRRSPTRS